MPIYITEDEEYSESLVVQNDEDFILANEIVLEEESDEYQRGYMNALIVQQRKYTQEQGCTDQSNLEVEGSNTTKK